MGNITGRSTIGVSQVTNAGTTSNDADEEIDLYISDNLTVPVDNTNAAAIANSAAAYDWTRNGLFVLADGAPPPTGPITITVPAVKRARVTFKNATAFDATIAISGQSETPDSVAAGTSAVFASDGANIRIAGSQGTTEFTGLTDTPANYAGSAAKALAVNSGGTAVEFVDFPAGAGDALPFTLSPAWRGCELSRSADTAALNATGAGYAITFDQELSDTGGFHDTVTNNTRITIPAGVTKVEFFGGVQIDLLTGNTRATLRITKNGATNVDLTTQSISGAATNRFLSLASGPVSVVAGDYFELHFTTASDTSITLKADHTRFRCSVLETVDTVPSLRTVVASLPARFRGVQLVLDAPVADADLAPPVQIDWDTATVNADGMWEGVTNPSRITVPAGVSRVSLEAMFEAVNATADAGDIFIHLYKNGVYDRMTRWHASKDNVSSIIQLTAADEPVVQGDYFEVRFGYSGADVTIGVGTSSYFRARITEFNSSTDAVQAYIAVPPEWRGILLGRSSTFSVANSFQTLIPWNEENSSQNSFDPGDGGPPQRFWFGSDWTFVDGDVTVGTDVIAETAHGYQTGEGPVRLTSSGTLPAGLAINTNYWIIAADANSVALATSRANALADIRVDITAAADGGTHTIDQDRFIVVPANVSYMNFSAASSWASSGTGERFMELLKQAAGGGGLQGFEGGANDRRTATSGSNGNLNSPTVSVVEGERYCLRGFQSSGGALNWVSDGAAHFGATIIEESRAITYPGVTVTPPWRGAKVSKVSAFTGQNLTSATTITWDEEIIDTDGFHSTVSQTERLTVPSGRGIQSVGIGAYIRIDNDGAIDGDMVILLLKNGSEIQRSEFRRTENRITTAATIDVPYEPVIATDYFQIQVLVGGDTSVDISASSYFWLEVIETDENAFPPEPVEFFVSDALFDGVLPTTGLIYKKIAARRFTLSDDFARSVGHSQVTAIGATVFNVNRNGAKIGEINVANTAQTATFTTTAATTEVFDVGDRLEVAAPSAWNAIDEFAVSLWAWRS